MSKSVVLHTKDKEVFVELSRHYLLYVVSIETIEALTSRDIVLLIDCVVEEHSRQTVH